MLVTVIVGVALSRPPKTDEYRKVIVHVDTSTERYSPSELYDAEIEAMLIACQIASCGAVMAVSSEIEMESIVL